MVYSQQANGKSRNVQEVRCIVQGKSEEKRNNAIQAQESQPERAVSDSALREGEALSKSLSLSAFLLSCL